MKIFNMATQPLKFNEMNYLSRQLPYARHHNPLLIRNRSWILTIHKDRILWKNLLENKEMDFKNGVKNIPAAGYNGARTVDYIHQCLVHSTFGNFVFSFFSHFSCVISFTMCSCLFFYYFLYFLNFCLAHLALQLRTQ